MIHGAVCDGNFYSALAERMSSQYRVILYDRRGCGRSEDSGDRAEDSAAYFRRQASDAACVLEQLGARNTVVLGCSLGALVALYLAHDYPELVSRTLMHEPPAYTLMADDRDGWEQINGILESIGQGKYIRALNRFLLFLSNASASDEQAMTAEEEDSFMRNGLYFIEHEFAFGFDPKLPLPLLSEKTKPAFLRGGAGVGTPLWICAERLAERQGCGVFDLPGGHNGARERPQAFADGLCRLLDEFRR